MIIVAMHTSAANVGGIHTKHFDAILQLLSFDTESAELLYHGGDTIALLHTLVRNAYDLSGGANRHRSQHTGGHERVRQMLHVDVYTLQLAALLPGQHCGGVVRDGHPTAHPLQEFVKVRISLQRLVTHSFYHNLCSGTHQCTGVCVSKEIDYMRECIYVHV
jgi:hypothetical protein